MEENLPDNNKKLLGDNMIGALIGLGVTSRVVKKLTPKKKQAKKKKFRLYHHKTMI